MSSGLADTPDLGIRHCPGCEPDRDPTAEILETRWCELHTPPLKGPDDAAEAVYISGSGEAGGADNAAACDFFHRKRLRAR
jgi:hypothetical protein